MFSTTVARMMGDPRSATKAYPHEPRIVSIVAAVSPKGSSRSSQKNAKAIAGGLALLLRRRRRQFRPRFRRSPFGVTRFGVDQRLLLGGKGERTDVLVMTATPIPRTLLLMQWGEMAVSRLIRVRYGSVVLPKGLRRSVWVDLDENDVRRLRQLAGADNPQRNQQQRDDGPRDNAPREGGPREGGQREGGQRNNNQPRNERGPRADNGPRANSGGGQQPKQRDRGERNNRGRDRGGRQDNTSSPAPFREPGDPSYIPNPLQQTFDRRAIQQRERPVVVDYDDGTDGPIGPIPNPLQQTYDKRGLSGKSDPFGRNGKGKRGGGGGGGGGGGEKQPDPLKTAVGYIGADTFIKKLNNRGGGGGRGRR